MRRGTPEQFIRFLHRSLENGYESALQDTYRIASVAELEREWNSDLTATQPASAFAPAQVTTLLVNRIAVSGSRPQAAQISIAPISWQTPEPAK